MEELNIINILPHEILFKILSNISIKDIYHVSQVCSYLNRICSDDYLWKMKYKEKFIYSKAYSNESWKNNILIANNLLQMSGTRLMKFVTTIPCNNKRIWKRLFELRFPKMQVYFVKHKWIEKYIALAYLEEYELENNDDEYYVKMSDLKYFVYNPLKNVNDIIESHFYFYKFLKYHYPYVERSTFDTILKSIYQQHIYKGFFLSNDKTHPLNRYKILANPNILRVSKNKIWGHLKFHKSHEAFNILWDAVNILRAKGIESPPNIENEILRLLDLE